MCTYFVKIYTCMHVCIHNTRTHAHTSAPTRSPHTWTVPIIPGLIFSWNLTLVSVLVALVLFYPSMNHNFYTEKSRHDIFYIARVTEDELAEDCLIVLLSKRKELKLRDIAVWILIKPFINQKLVMIILFHQFLNIGNHFFLLMPSLQFLNTWRIVQAFFFILIQSNQCNP